MRRLLMLPVMLLTLPAAMCGTAEPGIEIRTVEKVVEVQKPCPATAPVQPAPIGPLPSDANALAAVLGAKLLEYVGPGKYADQVAAYVRACPPADQP